MSTDALAEELKLVEEDMTRFRETPPRSAPTDQLEARREELLRRLGQPVRTNGSWP